MLLSRLQSAVANQMGTRVNRERELLNPDFQRSLIKSRFGNKRELLLLVAPFNITLECVLSLIVAPPEQ